ncbi:hypothetical protein CLV31_11599 [Algoriphagus aquaeductus]|uniref:Glycosyl transferase family 1 n=1 Tax=Algoriphagus aquaeductus TaxID=475299 RepID=A0A326RMR4_9BACT|nr:glycosyltransferase [Algoriphagus aquaeductus]PZV79139.1 hypothetical protein CLV31_11599 [Algoriphagus aquaeductus]
MEQINLFNIPNYYSSFYHLGLSLEKSLRFSPKEEFAHLNGRPFLVFEYKGRIVVIDNDDPVGIDKKSYDQADLYFATNKLLNKAEYNWPKVHSIYPHYPIDNSWDFLKTFGLKGILKTDPRNFLKQWYTLYQRPGFENRPVRRLEGNYVFFAGSIWKKESWANKVRVDFIHACRSNPLIDFEGGMNPRSDGDLCGVPPSVIDKRYTPDVFAQKSSRSIIGFINPAVLEAVSWRLAEYWNYNCFVIGFPFKIDLPTLPEHGKHIHYIQDSGELPELLNYVLKNRNYLDKIALGGKEYFQDNCLPGVQARRILSMI